MEKFNLNFKDKDSTIKSICWIFSLIGWLMFIITGWISFRWLKKYHIVWTIQRITEVFSFPIQMHEVLIYMIIAILMICALAGFIVYIIFSTAKSDEKFKGNMLGEWSRFHFVPLLFVSALFIIGECINRHTMKAHHFDDMIYSCFIFTILALASLIFIYFMTEPTGVWYQDYTIKYGTYSILIILLWYNFCYVIYQLRMVDKGGILFFQMPTQSIRLLDGEGDDWLKGCSIAFSLIFGIGSLAFSYFGKDIVAAGTNLLIYIGMTSYFFKIEKNMRADKTAGGVIDIIMIVLSAGLIGFFVYKKLSGSSQAAL